MLMPCLAYVSPAVVAVMLFVAAPLLASSPAHETSSRRPLAFSNPAVVRAVKVETPPVLDGMAFDQCWREAEPVGIRLHLKGEKVLTFTLKACVCEGRIYLLVRYDAGPEARAHRRWHWDAERRIYVPGNEQEETLYLAFRPAGEAESRIIDVWAWRAGRTGRTPGHGT